MKMKKIKYTVFDLAGEETKETTLNNFFLEIHALIMHGVIAPFAVAKQIFNLGNAGGGMSPGVKWEPFEISNEEYEEIIKDITDRLKQGNIPGPHGTQIEKVIVDKEFDNYTEWTTWIKDVAKKYSGRIIDIPEDEQKKT
jgi:hypothetical protein